MIKFIENQWDSNPDHVNIYKVSLLPTLQTLTSNLTIKVRRWINIHLKLHFKSLQISRLNYFWLFTKKKKKKKNRNFVTHAAFKAKSTNTSFGFFTSVLTLRLESQRLLINWRNWHRNLLTQTLTSHPDRSNKKTIYHRLTLKVNLLNSFRFSVPPIVMNKSPITQAGNSLTFYQE